MLRFDLHTDCEIFALVPDRLGRRKCLWNPNFECLNSIRNISDCIFYVLACVLGTLAGIEPSWRGQPRDTVDNQRSCGVVIARETICSGSKPLDHQRRVLHLPTYRYLSEDRANDTHHLVSDFQVAR